MIRNSDDEVQTSYTLLDSLSSLSIGSMSWKVSIGGNFDEPTLTASEIPAAFHPLLMISFPFEVVM